MVDIPKAGFGNTNDGNTSRRFFECSAEASAITGINEEVIKRFATILEVISSGHDINIEKFSSYCDSTAELYVSLYSWHPMTPTVHKVLMHGPLIVKNALIPIGTLSEEAAEVRNKHFRDYRENYSRKFSREDCNRDILYRLLLTSDPYLSSIRPRPKKISKPFSSSAKEMLLPFHDSGDSDKENKED